MANKTVGMKVYGPEIIVRVFEYYAKSRCLYNCLRRDYQFPYVSTLKLITSKVSTVSENTFLKSVFNSADDNQTVSSGGPRLGILGIYP